MSKTSNITSGQNPDTARCPLCGSPNRCAPAADPTASKCWCEFEEFPQELLAQIPEYAHRKVCICQNCLLSYSESDGDIGNSNER